MLHTIKDARSVPLYTLVYPILKSENFPISEHKFAMLVRYTLNHATHFNLPPKSSKPQHYSVYGYICVLFPWNGLGSYDKNNTWLNIASVLKRKENGYV